MSTNYHELVLENYPYRIVRYMYRLPPRCGVTEGPACTTTLQIRSPPCYMFAADFLNQQPAAPVVTAHDHGGAAVDSATSYLE